VRRVTTLAVERSQYLSNSIRLSFGHYCAVFCLPCLVLCLLTSPSALAVSKVEIIAVEVLVSADTESQAIKNALIEAIGRVNGRQMAALERLDNRWEEGPDLGLGGRFTSDMQNKVTSMTNGAVESYELLSREVANDGRISVRLLARIARLSKQRGTRLSLAVHPFNAGNGGPDLRRLARVFTRALSTRLTSSRRFEVIDRQEPRSLQEERDVTLKNKSAATSERLNVTADLSADLMISGTIEDASFETRQVRFEGIDRSFALPEGYAQISYTIRNVSSGEVRFAGSESYQFKGADFADLQLKEGNSPYVLIAQLASKKIARIILDASYPLTIVGAKGSALTLNQGGDLVEIGSVYTVYENGEQIFDPYTQEPIGWEESLIGTIRITEVSAKSSVGEWVEPDVSAQGLDISPGKYICRLKNEAESSAARARVEAMKRMGRAKEVLVEDW
jgi:TolB-like protein